MKKQELKKLAILGVASGLLMSAQVQANEIKEETKDGALNVGTLLAAGCGASCGHRHAPQGSYAPGPTYYNQQPQEIYYQSQIPGQFYPAPQQAYQPNPTQTYQQDQYQSYNPYNQPSQQELQQQYIQQQQQKQMQYQNRGQDQWESNNRNLQFRDNTVDAEKNRNWDSYSTSTSDRQTKQINESEFLSGLNNQSKEIFKNLDSEGKRLAIQFASQGTDKNEAVRMAQKKMADKRSNFDR